MGPYILYTQGKKNTMHVTTKDNTVYYISTKNYRIKQTGFASHSNLL